MAWRPTEQQLERARESIAAEKLQLTARKKKTSTKRRRLVRKDIRWKNNDGTINYKQYIRSIDWGLKRKQALIYHGRKCMKCQSKTKLQVHHKTYARLGWECMDDLEILCEPCHSDHHKSD